MSIDLTQQALNALADAGLGNDTPAEAYVIGYTQGHNDALALAIRIEQAITATPLTPDELDLLALALWEANGERPTVYESGKAVADDVLEWWKQVAASAWAYQRNGGNAVRRNGRPYAVGIMPIVVASSAALAVGYGLGEQAPLGEQEAQTVTQEVRRTGDVKRLCLTVKTGGRIDAITCQVLDDTTGDLT
jgi:hypothetical protein